MGKLQGIMIKLSWLAHHFPQLNNHDGNLQQVERFNREWILRFIGGILFVDKGSSKVSLRECNTYAWGPAILAYLYREMCSATDYKIKSIGERYTTLASRRTPPPIENKLLGHRWLRHENQHIENEDLIVFRRKLDIMKRHEFLWEPYTTNVMSVLPPICLVGSVAWCAVVPLICFQVIEWNQPDRGEVTETLQYMVSPRGRNTWIVDDLVPYVEKITILYEEQERIIEPVSHVPTTEHTSFIFSRQEDEGRLLKWNHMSAHRWKSVTMECITHHQHFLNILHRCINILSKVIKVILLQALQHWVVLIYVTNFLLRLTKLMRGDIGVEEILIDKHEDGNDHVTHPHVITDNTTNDFHVSV
ncbi:Serine/threonine-protein phosphatase 7 long form [Glycine soja]